MFMATDLYVQMGLSTVTHSDLQPPTLELHKKFIQSDKNLIAEDLPFVPKDLSTALYISQNHSYMLKCLMWRM